MSLSARLGQLLAPYRTLFSDRGLARIVAASLLARLPIGINSLAMTLTLQSSHGSFALAGFAAGAYLLGVGVQAPILGRWIDLKSPRPVLLPVTLAHAALLCGFVALSWLDVAGVALVLVAAAAGFCFPPVSMTMRAMVRKANWPAALKQSAFAVESILLEFCFIGGPLIASAAAAAGAPGLALLCSAGAVLLGVLAFIRAGGIERWGAVETGVERHWAGPLALAPIRRALMVSLTFGIAIGLLELGVTAYAQTLGRPGLTGWLFAAMSATSALSGLVYGMRLWRLALSHQCLLALAWLAVGTIVLTALASPAAMLTGCLLLGFGFGPALTALNLQLGRLAPAQYATETFTWSMMLFMGGLGGGFLLGGMLVDVSGWRLSLLASALGYGVSATICGFLPRLWGGS